MKIKAEERVSADTDITAHFSGTEMMRGSQYLVFGENPA